MTTDTETPRTDAALIYVGGYHYVAPDFARTLERALSYRERDLRECVELLKEASKMLNDYIRDDWGVVQERKWVKRKDILFARLKERRT